MLRPSVLLEEFAKKLSLLFWNNKTYARITVQIVSNEPQRLHTSLGKLHLSFVRA